MKRPLFTPEELAELELVDEEIDRDFSLTNEDLARSRQMDKQVKLERLDNKGRRIAAQKAAYREANKEKIADYQAAYREANKEKYRTYMREYMRRRRQLAKECHA